MKFFGGNSFHYCTTYINITAPKVYYHNNISNKTNFQILINYAITLSHTFNYIVVRHMADRYFQTFIHFTSNLHWVIYNKKNCFPCNFILISSNLWHERKWKQHKRCFHSVCVCNGNQIYGECRYFVHCVVVL